MNIIIAKIEWISVGYVPYEQVEINKLWFQASHKSWLTTERRENSSEIFQ